MTMRGESSPEPIRILHVVGRMNRGGVETWLMHVLRNFDRERYQMDFLVHSAEPGAYDDEIRALGGQVFVCAGHGRPWRYAANFGRLLRACGPYDVVHSHVHHFSGYVLWLARQQGLKHRIAHSHSDTSRVEANASIGRKCYLSLMKWLVARNATIGLAGSREAAAALFGPDWEKGGRCRVLYYGVDMIPFQEAIDVDGVRAELGIPREAFVVGHVGRFTESKNHVFLIQIARALVMRKPTAYLLLVGEGPLRSEIEHKVAEAGLNDRVVFAGVRADVPRILRAMDVFVLPSLWEGLPLVGIEAQAAGRPFITSDRVTKEVDIVPGLVQHLAMEEPVETWVTAIEKMAVRGLGPKATPALDVVMDSDFNIAHGVSALERAYGCY